MNANIVYANAQSNAYGTLCTHEKSESERKRMKYNNNNIKSGKRNRDRVSVL